MGNPCCCRGAAMPIAIAVTWLGQGHEAGKQRVVPREHGLLRWDLPSQLLRLLKMISLPFANELAAGRAPPASTHSAVLPLPPWRRSNMGSFSLCSILLTTPVGTRMERGRGGLCSTGNGGILPSQTQVSRTYKQH